MQAAFARELSPAELVAAKPAVAGSDETSRSMWPSSTITASIAPVRGQAITDRNLHGAAMRRVRAMVAASRQPGAGDRQPNES